LIQPPRGEGDPAAVGREFRQHLFTGEIGDLFHVLPACRSRIDIAPVTKDQRVIQDVGIAQQFRFRSGIAQAKYQENHHKDQHSVRCRAAPAYCEKIMGGDEVPSRLSA
jgi:hypothetical protein